MGTRISFLHFGGTKKIRPITSSTTFIKFPIQFQTQADLFIPSSFLEVGCLSVGNVDWKQTTGWRRKGHQKKILRRVNKDKTRGELYRTHTTSAGQGTLSDEQVKFLCEITGGRMKRKTNNRKTNANDFYEQIDTVKNFEGKTHICRSTFNCRSTEKFCPHA